MTTSYGQFLTMAEHLATFAAEVTLASLLQDISAKERGLLIAYLVVSNREALGYVPVEKMAFITGFSSEEITKFLRKKQGPKYLVITGDGRVVTSSEWAEKRMGY